MSPKALSYKATLEKRLCFRFLLEANVPGLFALINEKHKRILIVSSKSPIKTLGNIISELANNTHKNKQLRKDKKYLQLRFLGCHEHLLANKLRLLEEYKNLGYTIYNTEVLPQYKILVSLTEDLLMSVYLVSKGKRKYLVRKFKTNESAISFVNNHTTFDMMKFL